MDFFTIVAIGIGGLAVLFVGHVIFLAVEHVLVSMEDRREHARHRAEWIESHDAVAKAELAAISNPDDETLHAEADRAWADHQRRYGDTKEN